VILFDIGTCLDKIEEYSGKDEDVTYCLLNLASSHLDTAIDHDYMKKSNVEYLRKFLSCKRQELVKQIQLKKGNVSRPVLSHLSSLLKVTDSSVMSKPLATKPVFAKKPLSTNHSPSSASYNLSKTTSTPTTGPHRKQTPSNTSGVCRECHQFRTLQNNLCIACKLRLQLNK
jgi:hypothetical protein